jgi:hypothetical protein
MRMLSFFNGVITVPHGITDLFHAHKYDNIPNLCKIYTASLGLIPISNMIEQCNHNIHPIEIIFFVLASSHFRHDMPEIKIKDKQISRSILSSLLVLSTPLLGYNIFSLYMIFLHVPRHYLKCGKFLKPYINYLILSIVFLSVPGYILYENIHHIDKFVIHLVESLVVAHIIYNELYIDNMNHENAEIKI